ncbi:DUF547 domain-containing protein [Salinispira pacifica]|uniref:Uncharacterized protein DUF547 n=1 Tax=Salinispira pacifica TaxID=1307761 RepID=V5WDP9_9SPIO|nr:DUF547 domain-containing protein [Salinispira pacifica]AHC13912.1 Uncharacterized protein DUF547 [Salinispira pacifica]
MYLCKPDIRIIFLGAVYALLVTAGLAAAPQAELWPRWEAHDPGSTQQLDHGQWDDFLDQNLDTDTADGIHRMRYGDVSLVQREELDAYLEYLASQRVSGMNRNEQFAYWVNLYNALTVNLILEQYPVDSIRDISKPWDTPLISIEGIELTLNDIEHRILRPIWDDPRIHYAVNCASMGCPNLQPRAFTSDNNERLLEKAATEYINHPRGADFSGRNPRLSSIYNWYQEDFENSVEGVLDHITDYAEGMTLDGAQDYISRGYPGRIRYDYDWSLNE